MNKLHLWQKKKKSGLYAGLYGTLTDLKRYIITDYLGQFVAMEEEVNLNKK